MLKIKNVSAKNFMSVGNNTQAVNFDNCQLTLVLGENIDQGGDDAGSRNGTGKTTTAAKIAHRLQSNGHSVIAAAGDTFRAGAIQQLESHCENLGIRCISSQRGGDAAAIARDAIESAKAKGIDVVLVDTAGRMQNKTNLMKELEKVRRVADPHLVLFVGDALAGNDAVDQAKMFQEMMKFDGAVLSKMDTDAKGGAGLSIAYATGRPIVFAGIGQGYDDLLQFNPDWLLDEMFS